MDKNIAQRPVQQQRKRASTPRSKTGCTTCKIRRLKCGEERPSCQRCVKSGWQCDGYEHVAALPPSSDSSLASILPRQPSLSPTRAPSIIQTSMLFPMNEQERRYYQNYGEEVTAQLPGEDMFFWREITLRESITNSSVRHGLIAMGALKESTMKRSGRYQMDAALGVHREFALEHYHKAIQSLRESIPDLQDETGVRSLLVSCMILAIFDDFIGQRAFALQHMRYAREILLNSNLLQSTTIANGNQENDKLAKVFMRLDVLALCALGIDEYHTCIPLQTHTPTFTLPARISSFDEARNLSSSISWEGYNFFYHSSKYQLLPTQQIPPTVLGLRDHLIKQLFDLCLLLSDLKEEQPGTIRHPLTRINALRLHPTMVLIRLVSNFGAPETACDALFDQFNYLVTLCKDILQFEMLEDANVAGQSRPWMPFSPNDRYPFFEQPTLGPVTETYSPEIRTVTPLLLVATKCRNATIRREAIALLLSSHRREWMCDSLLSGQIGQWMMALEEEGMDSDGYIPQHARAWGESVELELQGRKAKVQCRQNFKSRVTGKVEWRWREKHICW